MLFKLGIQPGGVPCLMPCRCATRMRVEQKDRHVRRRLAEVVESGKTLMPVWRNFRGYFLKYVSNIVKVSGAVVPVG